MSEHWKRYVSQLKSLDEIEGVIMAARCLPRNVPTDELEALEARVTSLKTSRTADQARQIVADLRALALGGSDDPR